METIEKTVATDPQTEDADIAKGVRELVNTSAKAAVQEAKTAVEEIKSDVQKWLKDQETLREKKSGIYQPEVQDKRKNLNKYLREFLSAAMDNDVAAIQQLNGMTRKELTTDAEGSPFGGYVIDSELSAEIRHLITEYGDARREATSLQLSKGSYRANTLATDINVYWVDEGAAIKSDQVVLAQDSLELKKLAVIATLTRELMEDSEVDLFSFIAGRVAEQFAKAEDAMFFVGDGGGDFGGFTGILNNNATNEVNMTGITFSSLTADDLLDMQDATPSGALANARYYMHRSIMNVVRKLKDENGMPIFQPLSVAGPATIWGRPVVLIESMPAITDSDEETAFVLFGDLKRSSIFGFKGAISADRFNAGVVRNVADNADINLITTDREAIRWVERVGALHIFPKAVTRLITGDASA